MENSVEIFENEEFGKVRTVQIDTETWFVGKDVADALGYQNGSRDITNHTDEEDRLKYQIGTSGQNREQIIINESGLYSLIFNSKLESAKNFKRWVTKEVLPSIRKHGMYVTDELLQDIDRLNDELTNIQIEKAMLADENKRLDAENLKYRKYRYSAFRLKVKNNQDEYYIPDLTLQVIRHFVADKNNILMENENTVQVKYRKLAKELKKLILRNNDIQYVLISVGIRINDNNTIAEIDKDLLNEDYVPVCNLLF